MIDCGCDEILLPQGSNGVDGKNAFTVTTAQFVQPGVGNSITINVSDSLQNTNQWAIIGQIIKITDSAANGGWYQVTNITGTNQITAIQLDYPGTFGSTILVGAGVSPAGLRGPAGTPGTPGSRGDTGPANQLSSVVGVTQVSSTTPASASISGSYPNQKLNLFIPKGADGTSGKTLQFQYNSNASTSISTSSAVAIVPSSAIDTSGQLCPNLGDAFRVTFFCTVRSAIKNDGFYVQIQLSDGINNNTIELLTSNTTFNESVNMFKLQSISSAGSITDPIGFLKFSMVVHRLQTSNARFYVEWTNNPGFNNQKTSCYQIQLPYTFSSTSTKSIQVNAGVTTNGQTIVFGRPSLLVEKITA